MSLSRRRPYTNLGQLRDALLRCRYCGPCALTRHDFEGTTLVSKLEEGFFTYHLAHPLGGQHLYVTRVAKSEGVDTSYDAVVLAQYGAFFGRGEMLAIIRQLQGA